MKTRTMLLLLLISLSGAFCAKSSAQASVFDGTYDLSRTGSITVPGYSTTYAGSPPVTTQTPPDTQQVDNTIPASIQLGNFQYISEDVTVTGTLAAGGTLIISYRIPPYMAILGPAILTFNGKLATTAVQL